MRTTPDPGLRPRNELDGLVANVELTLISIVQGVALYFLADNAHGPLVALDWRTIPQIVVGVVVIFLVWSRTVMHAFTVIRWPIEYGHNFLYLALTLIEAVHFCQIGHPLAWFATGALYVSVVWVQFVYDLRMIDARVADSSGPKGTEMLTRLEAEHKLNIYVLMPLVQASWGLATFACWRWPAVFVDGLGATVLVGIQLVCLLGYLSWTLKFFGAMGSLVVAARTEWEGG